MDKDENIEKVVVDAAGLLMDGCCSRTKPTSLQIVYIWVTSTGTMHDAMPAMENREISTSHLLVVDL